MMLVKGCLELILVFINYKEDTNSLLVVKAICAVDAKDGETSHTTSHHISQLTTSHHISPHLTVYFTPCLSRNSPKVTG